MIELLTFEKNVLVTNALAYLSAVFSNEVEKFHNFASSEKLELERKIFFKNIFFPGKTNDCREFKISGSA